MINTVCIYYILVSVFIFILCSMSHLKLTFVIFLPFFYWWQFEILKPTIWGKHSKGKEKTCAIHWKTGLNGTAIIEHFCFVLNLLSGNNKHGLNRVLYKVRLWLLPWSEHFGKYHNLCFLILHNIPNRPLLTSTDRFRDLSTFL